MRSRIKVMIDSSRIDTRRPLEPSYRILVPYKTYRYSYRYEAYLGYHYTDCLNRALEEANKVLSKPIAKYFRDILPINYITT
ncbi:hypothetical protein GCG54_00003843 [Colletotrichum gloeosporioides]|uniref:Uncharacterized protein n=1 Tax=Colletotrichum gloeosporioides TaxID=474922 RepID=A0A8H4CES6_COLGL|nr:uncharacterized protein GCG54_00003843 [Colletotrichum gloeosporioides]KAF3802377.1 hypothetical protein GCG54_00003843 [Colletotrichum gloeosporioides]